MPTLKDVLKEFNGRINNQELSTALAATDENVEISQEGFDEMKGQISSLMTRDSAINSPDILNEHLNRMNKGYDDQGNPIAESQAHKQLKKRIMTSAEKKIENFGKKIGLDLSGSMFDDQIDKLFAHASTLKQGEGNEEAKKTIESLNNQLNSEKEKRANLKSEYDKKFKDYQVDSILTNKLNNYNLDSPYQKDAVKNGIFSNAIKAVKNQVGLQIGSEGQIKITAKDNPEMDYYNGNNEKIEDVDKLLAPHIQEYLKVTPEKDSRTVTRELAHPAITNDRSSAAIMSRQNKM